MEVNQHEVNTFSDFQSDLHNYVQNYMDIYQKEKFFILNRNFYAKMLKCFDNVRQTNEKIEECVKSEEKEKLNFTNKISRNYTKSLNNLENCADKCKSKENLKCLKECGKVFKEEYHHEMDKLFTDIKI